MDMELSGGYAEFGGASPMVVGWTVIIARRDTR
jgi:hypothetical protein